MRGRSDKAYPLSLIGALVGSLTGRLRGAVGLVGVAELLEGVAESSASVTRATFGLIVAAIGQIIFLSRHLARER